MSTNAICTAYAMSGTDIGFAYAYVSTEYSAGNAYLSTGHHVGSAYASTGHGVGSAYLMLGIIQSRRIRSGRNPLAAPYSLSVAHTHFCTVHRIAQALACRYQVFPSTAYYCCYDRTVPQYRAARSKLVGRYLVSIRLSASWPLMHVVTLYPLGTSEFSTTMWLTRLSSTLVQNAP
eukprot:3276832-Rhodomonas_salina.1